MKIGSMVATPDKEISGFEAPTKGPAGFLHLQHHEASTKEQGGFPNHVQYHDPFAKSVRPSYLLPSVAIPPKQKDTMPSSTYTKQASPGIPFLACLM